MKIAIVGGDASRWNEREENMVRALIRAQLIPLDDPYMDEPRPIVVSGHSPKGGVDIWAEEIARGLGLSMEIYPPETLQWNDRTVTNAQLAQTNEFPNGHTCSRGRCNGAIHVLPGFKSRNLAIAGACDVLLDYEKLNEFGQHGSWARVWSGGTWTALRARDLGKKVTIIGVAKL